MLLETVGLQGSSLSTLVLHWTTSSLTGSSSAGRLAQGLHGYSSLKLARYNAQSHAGIRPWEAGLHWSRNVCYDVCSLATDAPVHCT